MARDRHRARFRDHRRATLSQNFLHDPAALRMIVRAARLDPDALVWEPGAGEGTLTRELARRAGRVRSWEIDPALAARLPHRLRDLPNARPVRGDFLRARPPREPFAVVGNIPYSRTTDIVRWCLAARTLRSATLLVQEEYARKRAGAGGRWTLMTVRGWPEHSWSLGGRVSRHRFTPVPRVDSAVLRIERRTVPLVPVGALPAWRGMVEAGFAGVGGSLTASLARRYGRRAVREACRAAGVPFDAPVGLVSPDRWLVLFRTLEPGVAGPR
ncbi:ErmE/ErmH/ErmO/ErmR family 23S rRNA (adenine(2058)-N(6))-methyltransferase [Streptomyces sp. ST2-7A]|uniref:ErmE/ErmH/ErmO/ErmR family 23S rRNA (adenine(2058)-N(6))-methyltransferase n=1 Tax=Streptomyces sp. ST2-7A TaxID=2907214 RepID=UPI001F490235|nr:ErmE/ErmH/ErmO/ErmR family 23S rRNA (adenine(2058)-N(6))-methyltransferase [Streptomyces sp. ST2-7A]MCE7080549.1 ErmE/ErmH/ErmO/ErmR family 23S rRNA (adenine(2058)-N(6))-methyltransferase [Streptomyces sp. ST2-7A]